MKIVLASGSPRRRELMWLITDDFEVRVSDADESLPENIIAENAAEYLSAKKAEALALNPGEIVIGCDTVVVTNGKILGKPSSESECRKMLSMLSGRIHTVFTGVTILSQDKRRSFTSETKVRFFELSEKEISDYIATGEPFDKAGGYGIQGKGALLVKDIEGDFFNVVGLPVSRLRRELDDFIENDCN